ncbi:MAG: hypothetical protein U0235_19360 [Polyangiaceae bacterium]
MRIGSTLRVTERTLDLAYEIDDGMAKRARTVHYIADYAVTGTSLDLTRSCIQGDVDPGLTAKQVVGFSSHGQGDLTLYMTGAQSSGVPTVVAYSYLR